MSKVRTIAFGGKRTPEQALIGAMEDELFEGAKIAVVVFLDKDEGINTCWSDGSLLKRIGLLEFAKRRMIDISIEQDMELYSD